MSVEATLRSRNLIVNSLCLENHSERAIFNCDLEPKSFTAFMISLIERT